MPERKIVTLTTDFGLRDHYVASLKGTMLAINPALDIVDAVHDIAGMDVLEAAFILCGFYRSFPKGTVHLAVVDPGVGGARRPILVESKDYYFVGPDNGIFSYIYRDENPQRVIHLTASQHFAAAVSDTFHGRDIFGPVAAHLLDGLDPRWLGPAIDDFVRLPLPEPKAGAAAIAGQVVHVDRFGNLVTNIGAGLLAAAAGRKLRVRAGAAVIEGLAHGYDGAAPGAALALIGSVGTLEVSVNRGSAAAALKLARGAAVTIEIIT